MNYKIGQRVRMLETVGDAPSGDSPGGVYARPGEILVVRRTASDFFPLYISHEDITDQSFGVNLNEIELVEESNNG